MQSNPLTFDPRYVPPDDDRMRELDRLIMSGQGDTVRVPFEYAADVVSASGVDLYAMPCELRRLDYLRNAGYDKLYRSELAMLTRRWCSRRVRCETSAKKPHLLKIA